MFDSWFRVEADVPLVPLGYVFKNNIDTWYTCEISRREVYLKMPIFELK